jgi:hypothetical protein
MEISDVRRRVAETIDRARRGAAEKRARGDQAALAYGAFLDAIAVPLFRQVANVLRSEGFPFTVFTPAGSVRLSSDRAAEDFVELTLDTTGDDAVVMGHTSRSRGRRVVESEGPLGAPGALTEHDVLSFLLRALEPLVER